MSNDNVNLSDMTNVVRTPTFFPENDGSQLVATRQVVPISSSGPMDMSNVRPVDINELLPKRPAAPSQTELELFADLDAAVERECESITARHEQLFAAQQRELDEKEEAAEEEALNAADEFALTGAIGDNQYNTHPANGTVTHRVAIEDGSSGNAYIDDDANDTANATSADSTFANILDGINNDDLYDEDDETPNAEEPKATTAQEALNDLKNQIKKHTAPKKNIIDLSKFTISKKAISAQKVMKLAVQKHMSVADWVLPNAGRSISMTGLSGPEILKLNPENSNRNRLNTFTDMYHVIYDHLYDGNKPDFETWLKQLRFVDLQHVYFALYMATFDGSNYMNYSCPKCNKVFIETVNFRDMVVYADDETKAKVQSILKMDSTSESNDSYNVDLVQVSDSYVLGLRTPSVWNVMMETAVLSDQFLEKHADLIDMVSYIDAAYIIDTENNRLIPVDTKPDPNNMAKTSARKISAMYNIIHGLSSEEFYTLRSAIADLDENAMKVSYKIPGCKCPACGENIPDNTEITPDSMLFTRHQLAAIGNMSN